MGDSRTLLMIETGAATGTVDKAAGAANQTTDKAMVSVF